MELYRKHRPEKLAGIIGQDEAVKVLRTLGKDKKFPHALLLSGPSGVGKTTLARILSRMLKCGESDYEEINAANNRGIDVVRSVEQRMRLAPLTGETRVWVYDECHQWSSPAQSCILKALEDMPNHAYFILCTTDPQKLYKAIRTRCTQLDLKPISKSHLLELVEHVAAEEQFELSEAVAGKIAQVAEGSARRALVLLHQISSLEDEDEQLTALAKADPTATAVDLARLLLRARPPWSEVSRLLGAMEDEAETVRRIVLAYCRKVLLSGGKQMGQAFIVIECFRDNFYDSGDAGLAAACWEIVHGA